MPNKNALELAKAFGYLHILEVYAMKEVLETLPQNSICVNIGAGTGTSSLVFMECSKVGKLYSIDIFGGVRPIGGLGNERTAMREAGFGNDMRLHQIVGDSTKIGETWEGEKVDMVFVDGEHSYEHCKSDAMTWLPHIKQGGIIAFHDYTENPWIGVFTFVNELSAMEGFRLISRTDTFIAFRLIKE